MQYLPGGWAAALGPYLGERTDAFLADAWADERPALRGQGDFLESLARRLTEYDVATAASDLHDAAWCRIETVPETLAMVRRLRDAGYRVHLGTNQERHRAASMRAALGYGGLFDECFFSCELGAAKPEVEFFRGVTGLLGADPDSVLFVDDQEPNVLGARQAGLRAERWRFDPEAPDHGLSSLLALLAQHGIELR